MARSVSLIMVIARRELAALAWTPTLWGAMAIVAFLTGTVAGIAVLVPGGPAELRTVAAAAGWAMLLTAPALSLRPTTEERRSGFWEVLATSPVPVWSLVAGRHLAGLIAIVLICAVALGGPFLVLEALARPDPMHAACGALGVVLIGSIYLASGQLFGLLVESAPVAYLASFFFWMILLIAVRSVAPALPSDQADILYAVDPVRRFESFLDGDLDSFGIVYFVVVTLAFLFTAVAVQASMAERAARGFLLRSWGRPVCAGVAALALAGAAMALSQLEPWRGHFDTTKSRLWQIDPATRTLVDGLGDGWQITWIAPPTSLDAGVREQLQDVLGSFDRATGEGKALTRRIDPLSTKGAIEYEQWLAGVVARKRPDSAEGLEALTAALVELEEVLPIAAQAATELTTIAKALPDSTPDHAQAAQFAGGCRALAAGGGVLVEQMRRSVASSSAGILPDWIGLARLMAASNRDSAAQLAALNGWLAKCQLADGTPEPLRACAQRLRGELSSRARRLLRSVEALDAIGDDPLAEVSMALAEGGAIVVESPAAVAVIAEGQLGAGGGDLGAAIRFDRRFRIEQLVAGGIRSILDAQRPQVVFVHALGKSILAPTPDGSDCAGVADALRTARVAVSEWRVGEQPRPIVGATTAWFILPPRDFAIEQDAAERALLEAATALAAEGRPIFLSIGPSLRPLSGRVDPWAELSRRLGASAQTDTVVVEDVPVAQGKTQRRTLIEPSIAASTNAVVQALGGERIALPVAVPVHAQGVGGASPGETLLAVESRPGRRLERDWRRREGESRKDAEFSASVPVAVTLERQTPAGQRIRSIVLGCPTWMLSATADFTRSLGGSREALLTPGNRELAVNGALWLAGLDGRIGPAGSGREAPRIGPIAVRARLELTAMLALAIPVGALGIGGAVLVWRRRA